VVLAARVPDGPRVRVAALIVVNDRIVLVKHRARDSSYYLLPGGGVDYRETLERALMREVSEETGLLVEIGRPLLINDTIDPWGSRHVVNITFLATVVGGQITDHPLDPRVESVELFEVSALAGLDLRPPLAAAIVAALEGSDTAARYLGSLFTEGRGV
jgi:8-oxo-dGTP diphosphatase